ncbi:hypothetical protein P7C71_g1718, partial [Lecanoromycetidae sp. Uapishka_2]
MPSKLTYLTLIATFLGSTLAAPAPVPQSGSDGHAYECPSSANAPARKAALQKLGATDQDLAITILETSCNMDSDYPYGDVEPASAGGGPKTGDAANFGLFKNNWLQIRTYCTQFQGQNASDWNNGAVLNSDDGAAIICQHEQQQKIPGGIGAWWGAQR